MATNNQYDIGIVIDEETNMSLDNLFNMGMPFPVKLEESTTAVENFTDTSIEEKCDNLFNWDRPLEMGA
jgi:hypothetical protein